MKQEIICGFVSHREVETILRQKGCQRFLLVCDGAFDHLELRDYFEEMSIPHERFDQFTPNPRYEDVCLGVEKYRATGCDAIVAVGGGSTIDVAKCIKMYAPMPDGTCYLQQPYVDSGIPLVALPTTAGTGSESTRFAVIYYHGEKQSVHHDSLRPDVAVLDPAVLRTLPTYQKKCTLLDALCQALESWWSVNSTPESRQLSRQAVEGILSGWRQYIFDYTDQAALAIMKAANLAGQAIHITTTTAPHAMSYKLTSLYGLPHGHAVALCFPRVWEYMLAHIQACADSRGPEHLAQVFEEMAAAMGAATPGDAIARFDRLLAELEIAGPQAGDREKELKMLTGGVNVQRLSNNPVPLSEEVLYALYCQVVK